MKKFVLFLAVLMFLTFACTKDDSSSSPETAIGPGGDSGQGGSMAKFSISGDHLFIINDYQLKVYDITNETQPREMATLQVDFGIETVFTLDDFLFIGSINGMHIYDISNPLNIKYLSYYEHITSCDPVVANDSLAFVTLNATSSCSWQGGANRLDVLDITNKVDPKLLSSVNMSGPKGLGIYENYVIVCNSENGVEIYDFSNPYSLDYVSGISGIDAYDVIVRGNHLLLIGQDGLFQYDISNIEQIELLSNILFQ